MAGVYKAAAMGRQRRRTRRRAWGVWARPGSEVAALVLTALVGVIAALGWLADTVAGASPWWRLVLFAAGVLALGMGAATLLRGWLATRPWLARRAAALPAEAGSEVRRRLRVAELDALNQRQNAFLAAATLRRYLDEMHGDLFLGLLAYNIGPRNGGLRAIMEQYGARDFATLQPYLNTLPRDYPIRVLSAALAYRLWRTEGRLPRYDDGTNAQHIQSVGVPGLVAARG